MKITASAKSGDGTVTNADIKMKGSFHCADCCQRSESEKPKQLHWQAVHDHSRHQEGRAQSPAEQHVRTSHREDLLATLEGGKCPADESECGNLFCTTFHSVHAYIGGVTLRARCEDALGFSDQ